MARAPGRSSAASRYGSCAWWPTAAHVGFSNSARWWIPFHLFLQGRISLIATALVIILSVRYLQVEDENHGEYYALILFATVGMMFMASGYDLIVQFLGLETAPLALSFSRAGGIPAPRQAF